MAKHHSFLKRNGLLIVFLLLMLLSLAGQAFAGWRECVAHAHAPWPVKKGGFILAIYQHSLSLVFVLLFILSFIGHAYGTMRQLNEEEQKSFNLFSMLRQNRFWFESLQNWQSEFLSVASIVFFSIYLRQKGSPESKPVDSPHDETGK